MFQTLKYVYEIYKEGSFSRAAKNLYISQPSLSATIKKLEQDIGVTIFDRSTTPVQLTDAGKVYIETTRQISTSASRNRRSHGAASNVAMKL